MKETVAVEQVSGGATVPEKQRQEALSLPVESEAEKGLREAMEAKEAQALAFVETIRGAKIIIDPPALPVVHEALNVFTHYQITEHMVPVDQTADTYELTEVPIAELGPLSIGDIRDIYKVAMSRGFRLCSPQIISTYAPKVPNLALGIPLISQNDPYKQKTLRLERGEEGRLMLKSMAVDEDQPLPSDTVFLFYAPKQQSTETKLAQAVTTE
jgi:hypothetical protein